MKYKKRYKKLKKAIKHSLIEIRNRKSEALYNVDQTNDYNLGEYLGLDYADMTISVLSKGI